MNKTRLHVLPEWVRAETQPALNARGVFTHPDLPASTALYRYMTLETAELVLRGSALWMRSPQDWADPYERWWCEELFRADSKLQAAKAYAICWTSRSRDEPIWRIYTAPGSTEPAVRFKTTAGKLIAWANNEVQARPGKAFLGRVRYWSESRLLEAAKVLRAGSPSVQVASVAAKALHLKRRQFKLEAETRLLWIETSDVQDPHRDLPIDGLIDQIMIGPTIDPERRTDARRRLLEAGASIGSLRASTLYHGRTNPKRSNAMGGGGPG